MDTNFNLYVNCSNIQCRVQIKSVALSKIPREHGCGDNSGWSKHNIDDHSKYITVSESHN